MPGPHDDDRGEEGRPIRLLHIVASPRGERSGSTRMARAFIDAFCEREPACEVRTLDIWRADLPHFDAMHAEAKFAPMFGEKRDPAQVAAWDRVQALIRDFDACERLVLSCPMWNFSVPHRLKLYLDILVQPGLTFGFDFKKQTHIGLLDDRPTQLILTRSSTPEGEAEDYQLPYLKHILRFVGIGDVRALVAGRTTRATAEDRASYIEHHAGKARDAAANF